MKRSERGQSIVLAGVFLSVLLILVLVVVEIFRMFLMQNELNRAAEAAGKSGLILVGDKIMAFEKGSGEGTESQTQSSTPGKITSEDSRYLFSPPVQTQVAREVLTSLERNGIQLDDSKVETIIIEYPASILQSGIALRVQIEIKMDSLLKDLLLLEDGVITGQSLQSIPQR